MRQCAKVYLQLTIVSPIRYCYYAVSINWYNVILSSNTSGHRTHNPKVEGSNPSPAANICIVR
jgi:hypothetical protein